MPFAKRIFLLLRQPLMQKKKEWQWKGKREEIEQKQTNKKILS